MKNRLLKLFGALQFGCCRTPELSGRSSFLGKLILSGLICSLSLTSGYPQYSDQQKAFDRIFIEAAAKESLEFPISHGNRPAKWLAGTAMVADSTLVLALAVKAAENKSVDALKFLNDTHHIEPASNATPPEQVLVDLVEEYPALGYSAITIFPSERVVFVQSGFLVDCEGE
jgi:hypothetical protein